MTLVTLVTGASSAQREQAIADRLEAASSAVILLEGFPTGNSVLENTALPSTSKIVRIAAGCMCCTGNLVLRVTLNRILRHPPQQIFLSIADASHADSLRRFLQEAPYDELLVLGDDCRA